MRNLVVASVSALSLATAAQAADPPWPPAPAPRPLVLEAASGWYLRGDLGYRATTINAASTSTGAPGPVDNRVDSHFWGGVGVGFKADQARVDLTADFGAETGYGGSLGATTASAQIQTLTVLANAYYDIGTWWRVTPYIGAGAGVAQVRVSDYQSAVIPPLSTPGSFERFNLAWALMVGANYQFTPRLSVDAGYRFLDQGAAKTVTSAAGNLTLTQLQSHEFRIGVRWMYDAPWAYIR
jgi:opacity protein-like surface antigen